MYMRKITTSFLDNKVNENCFFITYRVKDPKEMWSMIKCTFDIVEGQKYKIYSTSLNESCDSDIVIQRFCEGKVVVQFNLFDVIPFDIWSQRVVDRYRKENPDKENVEDSALWKYELDSPLEYPKDISPLLYMSIEDAKIFVDWLLENELLDFKIKDSLYSVKL